MSEPSQDERVAQLQRERDAYREALRLLLDAVERGFHLTSKHPLVAQATRALKGGGA